jgi:hypothetical protein
VWTCNQENKTRKQKLFNLPEYVLSLSQTTDLGGHSGSGGAGGLLESRVVPNLPESVTKKRQEKTVSIQTQSKTLDKTMKK